MCLEVKTDVLFKRQKDVMEHINNTESYVTGFLLSYAMKEYDRLSKYHGSGKDMLNSEHYKEFMETKWCMVFDRVRNKTNYIMTQGMIGDYYKKT